MPVSALKKRPFLLYSGLLFLLSWLLYANTLSNKFAFDDKSLVVENRLVNESYTISEVFSTNYRYGSGFIGDGLYRPLVILSFILNKTDSVHPFPFHLVNCTLNALNTILLFSLFMALTKNLSVSFLGSVIFAFHPIHTEAVANIAGRPELLCMFFMLLSWISTEYLKNSWISYFSSGLFLFAALLSKETAVMLPFMVIAVDAVLKRPVLKRPLLSNYIVMVVIITLYFVIRLKALSSISLGFTPDFVDNPIAGSPAGERIATAFSVFIRYIVLLLFPVRLSADYSYNQIPIEHSLIALLPALGFFLLLGLIIAAVYSGRKNKIHVIGAVIFFFPYVLISNIVVPIGTIMGERLLYVPSAGFSLVLGAALTSLIIRRKRMTIALVVILLSLYGARTITRNNAWTDDTTLFSTDLKNAPRSTKVLCNMGFLTGGKTGEEYYRKALEVYPESDSALLGLGKNLYSQRRYDESAMYYERAARLYPDNARCHYDFGTVLDKLGRYDDAETELLTAIRLDPGNVKSYEAIGAVYINNRHYVKSIFFLEKALSMGGNRQVLYNNLAAAHFLNGDTGKALEYVTLAEKLGLPMNPEMVHTIKSAAGKQ